MFRGFIALVYLLIKIQRIVMIINKIVIVCLCKQQHNNAYNELDAMQMYEDLVDIASSSNTGTQPQEDAEPQARNR